MNRTMGRHLEARRISKPQKPLVVLGARQIGKTYSIRDFGSRGFRKFHEINLQAKPSAHAAFSGDLDPQYILRELELLLGQSISRQGDELIFLDEIQECPPAITALKYFCESAPHIPVVAAGSLLGLHLAPTSFPVGKVDLIYMYPMSFAEVMQEHPNQILAQSFEEARQEPQKLSPTAHLELWKCFKNYLCTGGLPEPVKIWLEQGGGGNLSSLLAARQVIETNITSYVADFAKHAGKLNAMHIERVWQSCAGQLASCQDESTTRFKFKDVLPGKSAYRDLEGPLSWLVKAHMLVKVPIAFRGESPLLAYVKDSFFKGYIFDVGVLTTMLKLSIEEVQRFDFGSYKGYLAENFVATELLSSNPHPSTPWSLYAWNEGQAEIEFLVNSQKGPIPVEVKSGSRIRSQSLKSYIKRYHPPVSVVLSARPPEVSEVDQSQRINLPLYLASALHHGPISDRSV